MPYAKVCGCANIKAIRMYVNGDVGLCVPSRFGSKPEIEAVYSESLKPMGMFNHPACPLVCLPLQCLVQQMGRASKPVAAQSLPADTL